MKRNCRALLGVAYRRATSHSVAFLPLLACVGNVVVEPRRRGWRTLFWAYARPERRVAAFLSADACLDSTPSIPLLRAIAGVLTPSKVPRVPQVPLARRDPV